MLSDGRFEKQKGDSNLEKEDRIRQKEQWKQLSPSEKWQYFIDYYLWVTIGVTTGIVILIFLIVHFATKTSFVMGVMALASGHRREKGHDVSVLDLCRHRRHFSIDGCSNTLDGFKSRTVHRIFT